MSTETKNYITPTGWQALKDELYQLVNKERPEIVQIVNWAAGNGDRSENGDYLYGKRRMREIVGVDEIDTAQNKISWISPLARCLIKAREGDEVVLNTPEGREEIEILSVEYIKID